MYDLELRKVLECFQKYFQVKRIQNNGKTTFISFAYYFDKKNLAKICDPNGHTVASKMFCTYKKVTITN